MVDLYKVYMPEDLNLDEIKNILYSGRLTSGKYLAEFEEALRNYIGNPYLFVTSNNNYASLIAFSLIGLTTDDEVIASPMACLASNMPIINFGAKVVWADIDTYTGTLSPEDVKRKITSKTKAILHYHWCGYPGYVDEINKIGYEHGVSVIDDAIESFGSEYKGNMMGAIGTDITLFSFQTVRLPNSIDGGAIAFSNREMFEKAIRLRDYGIDRSSFRDKLGELSPKSDIPISGYNAIMNEVNAYIGLNIVRHTSNLINRQRKNAIQMDAFCDEKKYIRLNKRKEITPNYWIYSFLSDNQMHDIISLREQGYYASKVHLRNDHYSVFGGLKNNLTGVYEFSQKQISVPSGWWK